MVCTGYDQTERRECTGMTPPFCIHDMGRCGKPAVMKIDMRPQFHSILFYCAEHIPVGFNGVIPEGYELDQGIDPCGGRDCDQCEIGGCDHGIEVS